MLVFGPDLNGDGEELLHYLINETGDIPDDTDTSWSNVTALELAKPVKWALDRPSMAFIT